MVQRQFGPAAERYARSAVHAGGVDLEAMLAARPVEPGDRVLDLGCGTGHTTLAFAARGAQVVGIDLTEAMLAQARRLARDRDLDSVRFECGDAEALPYPDVSFDWVTCRHCAHHFADLAKALREAARVLRPGGALLVVDSVAPEAPDEDAFLNRLEWLRDPSHVRDHRLGEWRGLLEDAGLRASVLGEWPLRLDFADWTERMATPDTALRELRALLRDAPEPLQHRFAIERESGDWSLPIALLSGDRRER